jgi:hypothetical protein
VTSYNIPIHKIYEFILNEYISSIVHKGYFHGHDRHKFTDTKGLPVYLPCVSYHLPQMDVRLFSPHTYHQMHGGYSKVYGDCIKMLLNTLKIQIQIVQEKHNLPVVFDSYVSPKMKKTLASSMRSGLCHSQLNALDFFQENTLQDL